MNYTVNSYNASPDYKKAYEAAVGLVKDQYQQARNQITEQQDALPYQYQQEKNKLYSQGEQTRKTMDEINAQRGLYRSGTGVSDIGRIYAARDAGINDANLQQRQAAQQLMNRLNELKSQEATSIAGLQGREGQDLRQYALQQAALTGKLNGEPTWQAQQHEKQYADELALKREQQELAKLQALMNYNINAAQVTDNYTLPTGFTYGDAMTKYLRRLYGLDGGQATTAPASAANIYNLGTYLNPNDPQWYSALTDPSDPNWANFYTSFNVPRSNY